MSQVQLILTASVHNLGEAGDLVQVKPGYARNFLIPQGKAILATESRVKEVEHNKKIVAEKAAKELANLQESKKALEAISLVVGARAGDEGKLFGSVTAANIAELLSEKGFEIDRRRIEIDPIKEIGEHAVAIKLHRDVIASIKLNVRAEGAPPAAEPHVDVADPDDRPESEHDRDDE
jgi:large subunit ribosomal protein L9